MPADRTQRVVRHAKTRRFLVPAPQTELSAEVGSAAQVSENDILASSSESGHASLTKKNKLQVRHDLFMRRLGTVRAPYSKSHMRRLKKKAKGELSTDMTSMREALAVVEAQDDSRTESKQTARPHDQNPPPPKPIHGQIGERKHGSLTTNQRTRAFQIETLRHKLIIADKNFTSDPFQTLRTHAQNTLVKHQPTAH